MRVNVYGEELTDRVELVEKVVTELDSDGGDLDTFTFYGVRFWLKFPNQDWWIHRKVDGVEDDDSSAITIWAPSRDALVEIMTRGLDAIGVTDERMAEVRKGYENPPFTGHIEQPPIGEFDSGIGEPE